MPDTGQSIPGCFLAVAIYEITDRYRPELPSARSAQTINVVNKSLQGANRLLKASSLRSNVLPNRS
jgi:hypothetical protein